MVSLTHHQLIFPSLCFPGFSVHYGSYRLGLGMVVHACDPSPWANEEFKVMFGYIGNLSLV